MSAGVVDQADNRPPFADFSDHLRNRALISHVADHAHPDRGDSAAREAHNFETTPIQLSGDGFSDAAARAGDDHLTLTHLGTPPYVSRRMPPSPPRRPAC